MPRPDAPRPAPLRMDRIVQNNPDRFDDLFSLNRQIGNLNPDDLITLGDLGRGNGGTVTKVRHVPSNQILAKKVIRLGEIHHAESTRIMHELGVLKCCNSEYIIGYFDAYHRNGELNLIMEYMDGRSLDSILSRTTRIPEDILGKITLSVIRGLIYLRDNHQIMHRDIKPSNILVNSRGQIKICDFGVSCQLEESMAQSFVGTRNYMSPERITGGPYKVQSDIWSLGLSLVELALGMYPIPQHDPLRMYEGEPNPEANGLPVFALMECIINEPPPTIPGPPIFSAEFKDFVDRCLRKLPQERFDLRSIVQHQFVIQAERSNVDVAQWVCNIWAGVI